MLKNKDKEIAKLKRQLNKKPKEVIVEKEKIVKVKEEPSINIDLSPPKAIKDLEKKLQKKLEDGK